MRFGRSRRRLGLPAIEIAEKPWASELAMADANLQVAQYHPGAPIPRDALDAYDDRSTLHRYAPRNLFASGRRSSNH